MQVDQFATSENIIFLGPDYLKEKCKRSFPFHHNEQGPQARATATAVKTSLIQSV